MSKETNAGGLHDLLVDEPDLDAVAGDRVLAYLDGRISTFHEVAARELAEMMNAVPYIGIALAAKTPYTFKEDISSLNICSGDYLYLADADNFRKGAIMLWRTRETPEARAVISRLIEDPDCEWLVNTNAGDAGIPSDAVHAALRGLYSMIAPGPAPDSPPPALPVLCEADRRMAAELTEDVPEIRGKAGDFIVSVYGDSLSGEPRGSVRWLSLEEFEALRALPKGVVCNIGMADHYLSPTAVLEDRRKWCKGRKPWRSRLALVRPFTREQVVPIEASSDDAAIFELLCEVGGTMPVAEKS